MPSSPSLHMAYISLRDKIPLSYEHEDVSPVVAHYSTH